METEKLPQNDLVEINIDLTGQLTEATKLKSTCLFTSHDKINLAA